ncbi:hypothetical protein QP900_00105 [Corynebacterium marquesiae]|uniref:Secreted protein n=1 Tax=Corynebacterium marquesiae TaxID=2913503 RepID=A0ABU8P3X6_9CORY|nr:hypothetical protein [Corynebacterium marquesiae]MDK8496331.1 hypothetical protein [Corynebacterium marquesiae]MDK8530510.1 hypothetical protein [Corynebacterium marquesiae]
MTSRLSLRPLIAAGFVPLVAASLALSGCSNSTDESAPSFKGEGSGMTTVNNSDKEEETAEETTAAQETVTKESPEESPVVTVTQTEKQEAPSSTGGGQKTGVGNYISNFNEYGWLDGGYANCQRFEHALFAGAGPDGRVIICETGGGVKFYRSSMFDGQFQTSDVTQDGNNYYVNADPSIIVVTPSGVSVREGGGLAATGEFTESWQR